MKYTMIVLLALAAVIANGQVVTLIQPATEPTHSIPDHPMHAQQAFMRGEQNLLGSVNITSVQGERPMWEAMGHPAPEKSLGDVARACRAEHAKAEKATIVWRP